MFSEARHTASRGASPERADSNQPAAAVPTGSRGPTVTRNMKAFVAALLAVLVFNLGRLYEVYFGDDGPEDSLCLGKVQLSNMAEYIVGKLPG